MAGLRRAGVDMVPLAAVRQVVERGEPVDEAVHTRLKAMLHDAAGASGSFDAGWHLGRRGDHPLVSFLATSRSPAELLHRFDRLEPLLHMGNRTRCTIGERSVEVRHFGRGADAPGLAEHLFVCGAQVGMLERIGCRGVRATVLDRLTVWPARMRPAAAWSSPAPAAADRPTWVVSWRSGPSTGAPEPTGSLVDDLRRAVADQPAAAWTLAEAAARWSVSTRTLQRQLAAAGHRFAAVVLEGRMDAAEALLRRTRLPVTVVAYLCGFSDPAHLANTCRRLRGTVPSALRGDPVSVPWPAP